MSRSRRPRILAVLAGFLLAGLAPTGVTTPDARAAGPFCGYQDDPGLEVFTWDGGGADDRWETEENWGVNGVPDLTDAETGYVCLDADGTVVLGEGIEARLQAIDVAPGTRLEVRDGGKLFVYGDQATRPSTFRQGSTVLLERSTIGGPGRIDLEGLLAWRSLGTGAATMTTDPCAVGVPECTTTGAGRLVVADAGRLVIDERGVNLFSRYRILVRGEMILSGEAYVAADRNTAIELRPRTTRPGVGILDVRNDGGVYEGFSRGVQGLADVVNGGLILKRSGDGTSAITGDYSVIGDGRVEVRTGTLALPTGAVGPVQVDGGATYGTGRCGIGDVSGSQCTPTTDAADRALYRAQVPATDANGALVGVREGVGTKGQWLDRPVEIRVSGLTRGALLRATLRFDGLLVGDRSAASIRIFRIPPGSSRAVSVPNCRANGALPTPSAAGCVWRQRSERTGDEDLVMTIRTRVTSRWVGR